MDLDFAKFRTTGQRVIVHGDETVTVKRARPIDITRAEAIAGWMHRSELRWLATQAQSAQVIVEIGAWLGRSTRALADHTAGTVFSIDPWDGYINDDGSIATWMLKRGCGTWNKTYRQFRLNVAEALDAGRVVPIRKSSQDAIPSLTRRLKGRLADLVFIDGDHRYDAVHADISAYAGLVRSGGILAGHDYGRPSWPGVKQAVDEAFPAEAIQTCKSIWWTTRP